MDATTETAKPGQKPGPKKRRILVQTYWTEEEAEALKKAAAGVPLGRWVRNMIMNQLRSGGAPKDRD